MTTEIPLLAIALISVAGYAARHSKIWWPLLLLHSLKGYFYRTMLSAPDPRTP